MAASTRGEEGGWRSRLSALGGVVSRLEERKAQLEAEVRRKADVVWRLEQRRARGVGFAAPAPGAGAGEEEDLSDIPPSQRLIVPADVVDVVSQPDMTELEWCGTSGLKITLIAGLEHLTKLEVVSLRSNFVRRPSGLGHLRDTLRVLELYENRLRTLEGVEVFHLLEVLDVSYNRLGALEAAFVAPLGPTLQRLYVAENKLGEMNPDALRPLVNLRVLDLGGNNLREIRGLETLARLEELWLGKNKITRIQGLDGLKVLKRMSLQSNRITKMENLGALTELEELYLSDQGIARIEGLEKLVRLTTLDLTNNKLTSTQGLPLLPELTDLWLAANAIASYADVDRLVDVCPALDTLYLERNPIALDFEYRKRLKATLPTLTVIDATPIGGVRP